MTKRCKEKFPHTLHMQSDVFFFLRFTALEVVVTSRFTIVFKHSLLVPAKSR
ncbi:3229_t:CDS:2 [Funneliformis geosporum]|nr:3229_t:CDS:2 [Funneliformis geosporum]